VLGGFGRLALGLVPIADWQLVVLSHDGGVQMRNPPEKLDTRIQTARKGGLEDPASAVFAGAMRLVIGPDDGTQLPGDSGVVVRVRGEDTDGVMAVIEETLQPRAFIPPHVHENDVWVHVLSGEIGVLVGDEVATATAGSWASKPRSVMHAMWNASSRTGTHHRGAHSCGHGTMVRGGHRPCFRR